MTEQFKDTKAGTLPDGWDVSQIDSVSSLVTNGFVGTATPFYTDSEEGVIYLQGFNVRENRIDLTGVAKVTKEFHLRQQKSILVEGDTLTVQSGHIGTTAVVPKNLAGVNCHAVIITRFFKECVVPQFVAYYLNSSVGRARLRALHVGSSVLHINTKDLKRFYIPIPPLPEQRKIAEILSTWDDAIATVDALIAALQRRKQGLMQRLLTGQVRFAEFEGSEWSSLKAGEIFESVSVRNHGDEELLSVTQDQGVIPRSMLDTRVVMPEGSTDYYKLVEPGNFIISLRTFQGGIEYSEYRGLVSPAYTVLKPKLPIVDGFYKYFFKSYEFIGRLAIAVIGIRDGKQISYNDFAAMRLPHPSIDEQERIACVLETCDRDIAAHEQQLELLRQQKKGLMQRLLTGQVRVMT